MRGPLVRIRVYTPQQPAAMAAVLDDFVTAHATSPAAAKLSQAEVRAMFMNLVGCASLIYVEEALYGYVAVVPVAGQDPAQVMELHGGLCADVLDGPRRLPQGFRGRLHRAIQQQVFSHLFEAGGLTALEMEVPPGHKGVRGLAISWGFTPFDATRPHRRRLARQTFEARCQRHE